MDQLVQPRSAIDPGLLRAARATLDWTLLEAGQRAGLSPATVLAAEGRGAKTVSVSSATMARLRKAYEEAGVRFFDGGAGRGLQLASR